MFKSVEELQYEINDLKRQLSIALNENQLLKVKYRKLETAAKKNDEKIRYLMNPRKNSEMRRIVTENGANIILNLQRRNKELEEIVAQKDALNRKYHNEARTARLYSPHVQFEGSRKGGRAASPLRSPSPSSPNVTVSTAKIATFGSANILSRDNSSWSFTNGKNGKVNGNDHRMTLNDGTKVAGNPSLGSMSTNRNRRIGCNKYQDPEELLTIIRNLKKVVQSLRQQKLDAERAMRLKNLELENLATEMKAIRFPLKSQRPKSSSNNLRSSLADHLPQDSKCTASSPFSLKSSNSHQHVRPRKIELVRHNRHCINNRLSQKRRPVPHSAVPPDRNIKPERQKSSRTFQARQISLEAVTEQSEDIIADIAPVKELQYRICKKNVQDLLWPMNETATDVQSKPGHGKTEIQYSIDSEVSSDGEEVYAILKE